MKSREYTREEIQELFLKRVWTLVNYWKEYPSNQATEGLAFSILSELDGEGPIPGFLLVPNPSMEDKQYLIDRKENYFPEIFGDESVDQLIDIGGNLHEQFFKFQAKE